MAVIEGHFLEDFRNTSKSSEKYQNRRKNIVGKISKSSEKYRRN